MQIALQCAERKWLVFPCHNENKRPLTEHGLKDATRDAETITWWFTRWPGAMVGLKCGRESGIFVIDCDIDPAEGLDGVAAFKELFPDLPETITVKTPRGGRHYYFKYPNEGTEIRNSAGKLAPSIDVRGEGGYVIAAGSRRSDGVYYEALADVCPGPPPAPRQLIDLFVGKTETDAAAPARATPAPADAELAAFAKAAAAHRRSGNGAGYGGAALDAEAARVAGAPRGQRNHTLNRAAFSLGQLVAGGVLTEDEVRLRLRDAGNACGLIQDDGGASVVATLNSGLSAGMAQPRGIPERRQRAKDDDEPPPPSSPPTGGWQFHDETTAPPTAWLIKNVLPQTGVGLISGQWGSYKTTVALDLSVSAMTGAPFADRYPVKRRGGVAYFAAEGANGLASRLSAVASRRGHSGALPFAWKADCPPLMARDALATLTTEVAQADAHFEEQFSVPLVLVLIDTLIAAAAYAKVGDENDAALAQKIMSVLSRLSAHAGALVLGLDHFGKAVETGTRGSSAKEGHADVVLAILADRELAGTVTNTRLAVRKLRDGAAGLELPFAAKSIEVGTDPDGDPITRVVIDWQQQTIKPADADWSKSLRLLRQVLTTMMADHGSDAMPFLDGPVVRAVDVSSRPDQCNARA